MIRYITFVTAPVHRYEFDLILFRAHLNFMLEPSYFMLIPPYLLAETVLLPKQFGLISLIRPVVSQLNLVKDAGQRRSARVVGGGLQLSHAIASRLRAVQRRSGD